MRQRPNETRVTHQRRPHVPWLRRCVFGLAWLLLLASCQCQEQTTLRGALATDAADGKLVFSGPVATAPQTQTIILYNQHASSDVTIEGISLRNDPDGRFKLLDQPSFPVVLRPGKEAGLSLRIQLAPGHTQGAIAQLVVLSPDATNTDSDERFIVSIEHYVQRGTLEMDCKGSLDFGEATPGKSRSQLCTIRNTGSAAMTLEQPTYQPLQGQGREFFVGKEHTWPLTLQPDDPQGTTLRFVYQPKSFDELHDKGRFTIAPSHSSAPQQEPLTIAVKGLTKAPVIGVQLDLKNCQSHEDCRHLNTQLSCQEGSALPLCSSEKATALVLTDWKNSDSIHMYIRSPGNVELTVHDISTNRPEIIQIYGSPSGRFAPGTYGKWLVYYRGPVEASTNAEITIKSNAANAPITTIPIVVNPRPCRLYIHSARWWERRALVLGKQYNAQLSQVISIENKGHTPCHIKRIAIIPKTPEDKGSFALKDASTPRTLAAKNSVGDSFAIGIELRKPQERRLHQATLRIESDDPERPVIEYPLLGAEHDYTSCLTLSPSDFVFPSAADNTCTSATRSFTLRHTGVKGCGNITLSRLRWGTGRDTPAAPIIEGFPSLPHQMKPGDSVEFRLTHSGSFEDFYDDLIIESDSPTTKPTLDVRISYYIWRTRTVEYKQRDQLPTPFPQGYLRHITFEGMVKIMSVQVDSGDGYKAKKEKEHWRYDPTTRTLRFEDKAIPPPGARLWIEYGLYCIDPKAP